MKKVILSALAVATFTFVSCTDENPEPKPTPKYEVPSTYNFENVSFSGQTARLKMAAELKNALGKDGLETTTLAKLNQMFKDGKGFAGEGLDATGKKIRSTVASAPNSSFTTEQSNALREKIDGWLAGHANDVISAKDEDASAGKPGNLDGKRYVNAKGIEANQAFAKTFIGAVILDQVVNKYVSEKYLNDKKADHEAGKPYKEGKEYTALEHGWDEAYGYIFGLDEKPLAPTIETGNAFLGKYLKKVSKDEDFKELFDEVYGAFRTGRTAIINKDYETMHQQAEIIRSSLCKAIAVKVVYYLQKGKGEKNATTLHALSEAYGFVHAMKFVSVRGTQANTHLDPMIQALEAENGLWSISDEELDSFAVTLATYFGFTVDKAL